MALGATWANGDDSGNGGADNNDEDNNGGDAAAAETAAMATAVTHRLWRQHNGNGGDNNDYDNEYRPQWRRRQAAAMIAMARGTDNQKVVEVYF